MELASKNILTPLFLVFFKYYLCSLEINQMSEKRFSRIGICMFFMTGVMNYPNDLFFAVYIEIVVYIPAPRRCRGPDGKIMQGLSSR